MVSKAAGSVWGVWTDGADSRRGKSQKNRGRGNCMKKGFEEKEEEGEGSMFEDETI